MIFSVAGIARGSQATAQGETARPNCLSILATIPERLAPIVVGNAIPAEIVNTLQNN
jgi:hypothetical protein